MFDRRSRVLQALVTVVVVAAALTACASSSPTTPSPGTTAPPAASTDAESTTATAKSAAETGSAGATTTLTGTVQEGVESGCVVLAGEDGKILANLLGLDTVAAPVGSTVQVTGMFETDMMTTCQQGEPFTVTAVVVG